MDVKSIISLTEEEKEVIRKIRDYKIFDCANVRCTYCPFHVSQIDLPVLPNGKTTRCLVIAFRERGEKLL